MASGDNAKTLNQSATTRPGNPKRVLLQYAGLFLCLTTAWASGLIGCATPPREKAKVPRRAKVEIPTIDLPKPYEQDGLRITPLGFYTKGTLYTGISGLARNISGKDFTMCIINFDVVDSTGAKVADASASTQGLKANQAWRFQALFTTPFQTTFTGIQPGGVTTMGTAADMMEKAMADQAAMVEKATADAHAADVARRTAAGERMVGIVCEHVLPGGGHLPLVARIAAGSHAAQAGWKVGDRILTVDGTKVSTLEEVAKLINSGDPTKVFTLQRGTEAIKSSLTFKK